MQSEWRRRLRPLLLLQHPGLQGHAGGAEVLTTAIDPLSSFDRSKPKWPALLRPGHLLLLLCLHVRSINCFMF